MTKAEFFFYDVVAAFGDAYYKDLLTDAHVAGDRKPINLGTKDDPDIHVFYPLKKNKVIYALRDEDIKDLPIMVKNSFQKTQYQNVYDIITSYSSAKFLPEKHFEFRELVDTLCPFQHENNIDFILWKLIVIASLVHRVAVRVCSPPAFGKDSVMKVLGDLTGEVVVIANPTVAKLEYRLINKSIMLNEFANLKAEDRYGMEHFLQSVGDMSNIYEKHSRASSGTNETYDISKLSVLIAYNDLNCYTSPDRYFDNTFGKQTRERFLPLKFSGRMEQEFRLVPEAASLARKNKDFYVKFIRTIEYFKKHWVDEYQYKKTFSTKEAKDYGFENRWARGFDTIVNFIKLYSKDEEEAQFLVKRLFNCHHDYMTMVGTNGGLYNTLPAREDENTLNVKEESVNIQ